MKSIKMFGKSIPLIAIVIVSILSIGAFAALLTTYGTVTMSATVSQSVLIDGAPVASITDIIQAPVGSGTYRYMPHDIENEAEVDATIQLVQSSVSTGVTVTYTNELYLTNKDPSTWAELGTMEAWVTYNVVGNLFDYDIKAEGLEPGIAYMLIYYQDKQDRFVDWGGDPGFLLGTFTSTYLGNIQDSGSADPGDMPYAADWNDGFEADYTVSPDFYDHARGAKLWLVPSDCVTISSIDVTTWSPTRFLFETDLIRYFKSSDTLTIPAGEHLAFDFCYFFDIDYQHDSGAVATISFDVD